METPPLPTVMTSGPCEAGGPGMVASFEGFWFVPSSIDLIRLRGMVISMPFDSMVMVSSF